MTGSASRRHFFLSAAAGWAVTSRARSSPAWPSQRIHLAVIGLNGRGSSLAESFARLDDCLVTHLCDVDSRVAGRLSDELAGIQGGRRPERVTDLRRLLDDPGVDAIAVATPDHWHALATIWGCQAGKHVYVEKPASHTLWEGGQMVAAARKYDRVVQVGTQSRSMESYQRAVLLLRDGRIGRVLMARVWNSQQRPDLKDAADAPVPDGVNYDLWLGPAPRRAFNPNRFHYTWHWFWDYGTGDIGNDGIHDLDVARWGLEVILPNRVQAVGGRLVNKGWETPDTIEVTYTFPGTDQILVYEQRDWAPYGQHEAENGVGFYGTEGYMLIDRRQGVRLFEKGDRAVPVENPSSQSEPHSRDFLDAIHNGGRPHADIEEGHHSAILAHLGNIAVRVGRELTFDPAAVRIMNDTAAQALERRVYSPDFEVPERV